MHQDRLARSVTIVANDVAPTGGMERALFELLKGVIAAGDHVTVIARTCDLQGAAAVFHRVPGPKRPFVIAYPWFFIAAGVLLRRHRNGVVQVTGAIVPNRVDIVSVHFCHRGFAAKSGVVRTSRRGLPFRATARLAAAMSRVGERLCFRPGRVATLVAVSRGIADELRRHYPAVANSVVVIPNGVDVSRFAPRPLMRAVTRSTLGLADNALVALFVGGDWERKGLAMAIEAIAIAPHWKLLIAGTGDQRYYAALAQRCGVGDRVHFLGYVADTAPLFGASDVLVFPTAYEADPLVVLEAAASGLPVVATPVSGVVDLIHDAVSGFLIQRDAASIAQRLRRLAADRTLAARMASEVRAAAQARSWRSVVEQHRALYATIRGPSSAAGS